MRIAYHLLDVFTDQPLAGNPLAVVLDAEGLDAERMQAIAREFSLSETVFVTAPRDPVNTARLRIFTPALELPFAGHPTIGAACLIARTRAPDMIGRQPLRLRWRDPLEIALTARADAANLVAPMPGRIVALSASPGQRVARGAPLLVMEAMKMEHTLCAPAPGTVRGYRARVGEQVPEGALLVDFEAA